VKIAAKDKKTCSRCKGRGFGPWVVDMGRCFKCFGTGSVVVGESKRAIEIQATRDHLQEIEGLAAELKAAMEQEKNTYRLARDEQRLQAHRDNWVSVNRKLQSLLSAKS
jgi:DnaJ-class molecular chaperone